MAPVLHPEMTPVLHPDMMVSDLINVESKEWDVGLLEQYVDHVDIPMI